MRGVGSSFLHIARRRIVRPAPSTGVMARAVDESGVGITWGQPPPAFTERNSAAPSVKNKQSTSGAIKPTSAAIQPRKGGIT